MVLGIALCGGWQCFLMSPLWHFAVQTFRTFYTLQNARQQHCIHSESGQQVSSLHEIALEDIAVLITEG
jgi:hypothetical protein